MTDPSVQQVTPPAKSCGDKITGVLIKHWTVPDKHRSDEQDAAEKYLLTAYIFGKYMTLPWIRFNRWYLFFASFMVQFCIGSLYSWSVLNNPIDQLIYGDKTKGMAVNAFYIAVGVFGTSTAIMGPWIERNGPRAGVVLGAISFFIGCVISCISLHAESIVGLYVGYGLFCGFGSGLCYISPVSALQKWFPDYRGAAAGFAVGGYGAGSVVWGKAYLPIIDATSVPDLFIVIGCVMAFILFCCAVCLRNPHFDFHVGGLNMHGEAVREAQESFQRGEKLSVMSSHEYESIMTPTSREVEAMVDPNAQNTNSQVKKMTLIQAITSPDFCLFYYGLVSQITIIAIFPTLIRDESYSAFVVLVFLLTLSYGGGFGTIPCFLTDMFGAFNIGAMHGFILTAWSLGGVAGGLTFNAKYNEAIKNGTTPWTPAGFAVGGYGAGSVVWAKVYLPCIDAVGLSSTFILIGCVMAFAMYICAIILRSPHHEFVVSGLNIHGEAVDEADELIHRGEKVSVLSSHEYESITTPTARDVQEIVEPTTATNTLVRKLTLIDAIKTPDFLCMYIMFFANQLYGLIVLSKLSSMCTDIFNKTATKLQISNYTAFVAEVFILTASYGGGFGTIPAFLTDMFGAFNIGAMHGLILTAWSIGGVVGGISFNHTYGDQIADGWEIHEAYTYTVRRSSSFLSSASWCSSSCARTLQIALNLVTTSASSADAFSFHSQIRRDQQDLRSSGSGENRLTTGLCQESSAPRSSTMLRNGSSPSTWARTGITPRIACDSRVAGRAVNAFYIAVGIFGTTTAIMGPWIERNGPRYGVVLGTSSFLLGHAIVAIGVAHKAIAAVYVGYGLFCGFGMGLCYIAPVSALQKWFPDYRGTAAGFAVAGYGAGAVVWAKVYRPFGGLNMHGEVVDEPEMATENAEHVTSKHRYESAASENDIDFIISTNAQVRKLTLIDAIKTPDFLCMYVMFFANQIYGLVVLSKLSNMCTDIFIFVLTASYGGGFGTIPAFLTDMFGAFNIGAMHGLILTAWSIGGVVGGITFNNAYGSNIEAGVSISEAYISTVNDIFIIIVAGLVVLLFVRTNPMDRFESGYHFSLFGRRIISIKGKEEPPKKDPLLQII
ncbi:Major facilitator superfamily domain [Phytophthora cactorum]|nr:Major facilitator superfamily domain [Phytophthora cactorum]